MAYPVILPLTLVPMTSDTLQTIRSISGHDVPVRLHDVHTRPTLTPRMFT